MKFHPVIRSLLITLVTLLTAGLALAQEAAPRLTLVDPMKDFGVVPKGEKLAWSFQIKNTGTADLQITQVQPACGCTVAEYDKVIKPGETGRVEAVVDTESFNGPISKGVTIQSNDPDTPAAQVTIKAIVRPYVEAHPAGFVRYSLLQGEADKKTIILYTEEEEPFEIIGAAVPGDWVKVDHEKIENPEERVKGGRPGQAQYRVDVTVGGPTAPIGPLVDKIKIITNSKHQPEYLLSLSGVIRPSFMVMPSVLNFGEITPEDPAATRTVVLASNDQTNAAAFKVERVESGSSMLTTESRPTDVPGRYEVTIRVKKGAQTGNFKEEVKIYTTDVSNPIVTLPVTGIIKG